MTFFFWPEHLGWVKTQPQNGISPLLVIPEHSWPWGFSHPNTGLASVSLFSSMGLKNKLCAKFYCQILTWRKLKSHNLNNHQTFVLGTRNTSGCHVLKMELSDGSDWPVLARGTCGAGIWVKQTAPQTAATPLDLCWHAPTQDRLVFTMCARIWGERLGQAEKNI